MTVLRSLLGHFQSAAVMRLQGGTRTVGGPVRNPMVPFCRAQANCVNDESVAEAYQIQQSFSDESTIVSLLRLRAMSRRCSTCRHELSRDRLWLHRGAAAGTVWSTGLSPPLPLPEFAGSTGPCQPA
jgi:hypothetical protein